MLQYGRFSGRKMENKLSGLVADGTRGHMLRAGESEKLKMSSDTWAGCRAERQHASHLGLIKLA